MSDEIDNAYKAGVRSGFVDGWRAAKKLRGFRRLLHRLFGSCQGKPDCDGQVYCERCEDFLYG